MPIKSTSQLTVRPYESSSDYWRLRDFLRQTFLLYGNREYNWHVARLDYWRGHVAASHNPDEVLKEKIFIWETPAGEFAAFINSEDPGNVFLQTHPSYHNAALDEAMITLAEQKFAIQHDGQQVVTVWIDGQAAARQAMLARRGYRRGRWTESQWRRDLDTPIPEIVTPVGYQIRALGDVDELPARSWASWRGFHPDEPDQNYEGWQWYFSIQRCPLYRRDLDIVAIAPSGEIASFCTVWFDDVTLSAMIEPVATMPEHLRRGLARACITTGLQRVQAMGATRAFVGGYEPGANALYASTLSPAHDLSEQWIKKW